MHVIAWLAFINEKRNIRGKTRKKDKERSQQLADHVVVHELFGLQLHPGTINDEPIVARTLTSIVEDNVYVRVHVSCNSASVGDMVGEKRRYAKIVVGER